MYASMGEGGSALCVHPAYTGVKAIAYVRRAKFLKFVVFSIIGAFSNAQNTFLPMRLMLPAANHTVSGELPSDPT